MALCYLEKYPAPRELKLAWQAKRWESLPNAGGLQDQEVGLLERMSWALSTYEALRGMNETQDTAKWIMNNQDAYELTIYVRGLLEDGE